jgi:hypothetical protein
LGSEFHAEAYSEAGRMGKIMQEAIERGPCWHKCEIFC